MKYSWSFGPIEVILKYPSEPHSCATSQTLALGGGRDRGETESVERRGGGSERHKARRVSETGTVRNVLAGIQRPGQ